MSTSNRHEEANRGSWVNLARRKTIGTLLAGSGLLLSGMGFAQTGSQLSRKARIMLNGFSDIPEGLRMAIEFPLMEAIYGRRSRRFFMGADIPDGPFAFKSEYNPMPLSDLEQMLVLTAVGGNTGWSHLIFRHQRYAPHLSNYSGAAGGRTFPSSAGIQTSQFFYTDDYGSYFFSTRDLPSQVADPSGPFDLKLWLESHRKQIRKLSDKRVDIPFEEPYMEGHNTWVANRPGTTLIFPIVDLAQHQLALLAFLIQNGYCVFDDYAKRNIPGMEQFRSIVNVDAPYPLSYIDRYTLGEGAVELATACYSGALTLQAAGLGGWMFDGIDPYTILGASGNPEIPGFGFRYDTREDWPLPNITGLNGVFEAYCPPHYPNMRAAVEALVNRKFGAGGPFNPSTPGPWKETSKVRASAQVHDEAFKACLAHMAQYIYDTYGKFPATLPSVYHLMYLQAHHLDLKFYDRFFAPGSYLETHKRHMELWHS